MPALRLVRSSRNARIVGRFLFVMLTVAIVLMVFAPWQQSVTGSGNVIAFAPQERQQRIEAPIKGRIIAWGDGIFENAKVQRGQSIARIQDLDPELLPRLEEQLNATQRQVEASHSQLYAAERNLDAAHAVAESYQAQLETYTSVKQQIIDAANAYVDVAKQKVLAQDENLNELLAALSQEEADFERQKKLFEENIVSELKFQMAERKFKEAQAKVSKARSELEGSRKDLDAKKSERISKEQKAQVEIDEAAAKLRKANADIAKSESDIAKSQAELNKAEKELSDIEIKVSRQRSQEVTAPTDGYLVQLVSNRGGGMVKEGDLLCVIVPETTDRAVQIWLNGNDAPLVEPGRHVRLQFEGWPAVQFSGWPSVAVGTFGGTVASVDATDNGKGQFRCLIQPDETDQPWPDERFLRQGVRSNGWVLLKQVPLWFEVWRRLNSFPPVIDMEKDGSDEKIKTPKFAKP